VAPKLKFFLSFTSFTQYMSSFDQFLHATEITEFGKPEQMINHHIIKNNRKITRNKQQKSTQAFFLAISQWRPRLLTPEVCVR
jgi:hypothetical protein